MITSIDDQIGLTIQEYLNVHHLNDLVDLPYFEGDQVVIAPIQHSLKKEAILKDAGSLSAMFVACKITSSWIKYVDSNRLVLALKFEYQHPAGSNGCNVRIVFVEEKVVSINS